MTLRQRALDELFEEFLEINELMWNWRIKGTLTNDQYLGAVEELIEQRMTEISQRSTEELMVAL